MAKHPPAGDEANATAASRAARKERRRDRTREEILAAARTVLIANGVGAMTLEVVAAEAGMSKTGLYYYFPSKDALLFELIYGTVERHARAIHDAVADAKGGGDALGAIIRETIGYFGPRLDDFRLAFLSGQFAAPGEIAWSEEQFARLRPLNDLILADATALLGFERKGRRNRAKVEPRMLAFLAYLASVGLLTVKGMVERVDDPLLYSDDQLTAGLVRIFADAAEA